MKDKTFDERYYVLTLMGMARQLGGPTEPGIYRPIDPLANAKGYKKLYLADHAY